VPLAENFIANPNWDYGDGPESVTANNYTAGLVARYEGFSFEGGVFRTEIFDARDPSYNPPASGALLSHDLESEGFEIGAGYAWFDGFIRVAYANIDVLIDGEPADSDVGTYIATPIGEIITITGAHTFVDWGLTVGGDVKIVFDYDDVARGNQPLKGYEVVNLFTEYRPSDAPNLSFRAEINNVFDETYTDRATYGQEFSNVSPLREPGRSFLLSATARF
jgi:hemoglobin/transferrin/lactoferrin receptor protein